MPSDLMKEMWGDVIGDDEETSAKETSETQDDTSEGQPQPKEDSTPKVEHPDFEERFAKLEKQLKDKDDFIARQAQEIGSLRKAPKGVETINEDLTEDEEALVDQLLQNPRATIQKILDQRDQKKTEITQKETETRQSNEQLLKEFMGESFSDALLDTALDLAKQDGAPEETLQLLKDDFWSTPVPLAANLLRRAELTLEVQRLRQENDELKKGQAGTVKKLANAVKSRSATTLNLPSSSARNTTNAEGPDFFSMSREELRAWREANADRVRNVFAP